MAIQTIQYLKSLWVDGYIPTGQDYTDLFDTIDSFKDNDVVTDNGDGTYTFDDGSVNFTINTNIGLEILDENGVSLGVTSIIQLSGDFGYNNLTKILNSKSWGLKGNDIDDGDFIGVTNDKPLIIKSANGDEVINIGELGQRVSIFSPEKEGSLDIEDKIQQGIIMRPSSVGGSNEYQSKSFRVRSTWNGNGYSTDLDIYNVLFDSFIEDTKISIKTNGTSFFDGGNLAIGKKTATEKLEVLGKIKATSINFTNIPTTDAGLSSGDVWNDNGTLKIV